MGPKEAYDLINTGGIIGLLVIFGFIIVIGVQKQWWIPGWLYDDAKKDSEEWKELAKGYQERLDRLTGLVESLVDHRRPTR